MTKQLLTVLILAAPVLLLKMKPFSEMNGGVLLAVLGGLLGLGIAGSAVLDFQDGREALSWPTAAGTVYKSEVRKNEKAHRGKKYRAFIRYRYEVDGTAHAGKKVRFGPVVTSAREAEATAREFPVDAAVTVYYNPDDPSDAVLDPSRPTGSARTKFLVGIGFILAAATVGMAARTVDAS